MSDPCAIKYDTPKGFAVRKTKQGYEAYLVEGNVVLARQIKTENMANLFLQGVVMGVGIGVQATEQAS